MGADKKGYYARFIASLKAHPELKVLFIAARQREHEPRAGGHEALGRTMATARQVQRTLYRFPFHADLARQLADKIGAVTELVSRAVDRMHEAWPGEAEPFTRDALAIVDGLVAGVVHEFAAPCLYGGSERQIREAHGRIVEKATLIQTMMAALIVRKLKTAREKGMAAREMALLPDSDRAR